MLTLFVMNGSSTTISCRLICRLFRSSLFLWLLSRINAPSAMLNMRGLSCDTCDRLSWEYKSAASTSIAPGREEDLIFLSVRIPSGNAAARRCPAVIIGEFDSCSRCCWPVVLKIAAAEANKATVEKVSWILVSFV
jgi:hypothetical protein